MKQRVRSVLPAACLLALLTASALAQEQEPKEAEKKALIEQKITVGGNILIGEGPKMGAELFKLVGAKMGFETKVVKGAPYSATAESETVQTLADGNRITSKTTTAVYRDNEGRTRRESPAKKKGLSAEIFISDPVADANYVLETVNRIAIKSELNVMNPEQMKIKFAAGKQPAEFEINGKKYPADSAEAKLAKAKMEEIKREKEQLMRSEGPKEKPQPITESLGKQMVEGVECEGTRITSIIPAGLVGNELPIKIVREQWYSPELQVLVMTRQNDPRIGETTYRLTNISRSEPDRALFEVPSDYTVQDRVNPLMKLKPNSGTKPEEE